MPFDAEIASKGIIQAINNMTAIKTQNLSMENALLADAIKQKRELEAKRAEKQIMTPFEMIQARKYADENPNMDFSGIPGFPQRPAQPAAQQHPTGDVFSQPVQPKLEVTSSGFTTKTPRIKEEIYNRIQAKKNAGQPLTRQEQKFERKFLGVDDEAKTVDKPADIMRLRTLAKEIAEQDGEYIITEEVISKYMPQAKNILYPNAKVDDNTKLDIKLPGHIKKFSQAIKYLTEQGMSEMEAKEWVKARN